MPSSHGLRVFPGKGLVAAVIALAALAHGLLFSNMFQWLLLTAVLVLAVVLAFDWLTLRAASRQLHVALAAPSSITRGEPLLVSITVANDAPAPAVVHVRPLLPEQGHPALWQGTLEISPQAPQEIILRINANVRGAYTFGDIYLRLLSRRRLLVGQRRIAHEHVCRVYPDIRSVKEYLAMRRMLSAVAPHLRAAPLRGIGSEFESLRDYEEGDDIRRIDWKATARLSTLITRNYEIEHFRNVVVLIDRGRLMAGRVGSGTKLDYAIDAALMVCGVALDGGDRCGLLVFDQEVAAYLPPRGELNQLQAVLETVYDLQPLLVESHFRRAFIHLQTRLTRRSLVLVLSDIMDVEASRSTLQGLLALNKRHLVVFAALRTPEVEHVVDDADESTLGPYRQAVAYRLLRERAEVMARLETGGVHVLDVRPTELTVPLVNKYITLREQNLL
jgi:uncharacterized protein (DUF58 family)